MEWNEWNRIRLFYDLNAKPSTAPCSSHSFGKWIIELNRVIGAILLLDLLFHSIGPIITRWPIESVVGGKNVLAQQQLMLFEGFHVTRLKLTQFNYRLLHSINVCYGLMLQLSLNRNPSFGSHFYFRFMDMFSEIKTQIEI